MDPVSIPTDSPTKVPTERVRENLGELLSEGSTPPMQNLEGSNFQQISGQLESEETSEEVWQQYFDEGEQCYYFMSTQTNESRWAVPTNPNWMEVRDEKTGEALYYMHSRTKQVLPAVDADSLLLEERESESELAPTTWEVLVDPESGYSYYYSKVSNSSQWEAPLWIDLMDEISGHIYYYNNETGIATWEKPLEFVETAFDQSHRSPEEVQNTTIPDDPPTPLGKRLRTNQQNTIEVEPGIDGDSSMPWGLQGPLPVGTPRRSSMSKRPRYPKLVPETKNIPAVETIPVTLLDLDIALDVPTPSSAATAPPVPEESPKLEEAEDLKDSSTPSDAVVPSVNPTVPMPLQAPTDRLPPRLLPQNAFTALTNSSWLTSREAVRVCFLRDLFSSRAKPSRLHAEKVFYRLDKKKRGYLAMRDISQALSRHSLDHSQLRTIMGHFSTECQETFTIDLETWCAFICMTEESSELDRVSEQDSMALEEISEKRSAGEGAMD